MVDSNIVKLYTEKVLSVIRDYELKNNQNIYVFLGLNDVIDPSAFNEYILDETTFDIDGNHSVFSKKWFNDFFIALNRHDGPVVISFAQLSLIRTTFLK